MRVPTDHNHRFSEVFPEGLGYQIPGVEPEFICANCKAKKGSEEGNQGCPGPYPEVTFRDMPMRKNGIGELTYYDEKVTCPIVGTKTSRGAFELILEFPKGSGRLRQFKLGDSQVRHLAERYLSEAEIDLYVFEPVWRETTIEIQEIRWPSRREEIPHSETKK